MTGTEDLYGFLLAKGEVPTTGAIIDLAEFARLIEVLADRGFRVLGPALRDEAIVYDDISSTADLPIGWTDRQEPGRYSLERREDDALFGYAVGPHSWKQFLLPPTETLWTARRSAGGEMAIEEPVPELVRFAFIGVRSCELHAMAVQDKVLRDGPHVDNGYALRREGNFIVAVNCGEAGGTCFCVSMETGPKADAGFDLSLTELIDGDRHRFLVETGSEEGAAVLRQLHATPATQGDRQAAGAVVARTASRMGRTLETEGLREALQSSPDHPRWDDVADRCLSCTNCTAVCPTCFCTSVEDHTDLAGETAERVRSWDSCFSLDFSHLHDGSVRSSNKSRYRQWATHKFAHWIDQFGTSGCVGCGRCLTWCPVGIDVTEEIAAIRAEPSDDKDQG